VRVRVRARAGLKKEQGRVGERRGRGFRRRASARALVHGGAGRAELTGEAHDAEREREWARGGNDSTTDS
jgi:hypothetical protein